MKNYTVYFEIFGKKLKTKVLAESEEKARESVLSKVVFHKVEIDNTDEFNQVMDVFGALTDIVNGKSK